MIYCNFYRKIELNSLWQKINLDNSNNLTRENDTKIVDLWALITQFLFAQQQVSQFYLSWCAKRWFFKVALQTKDLKQRPSNSKIHFFGLVIETFAPFNHSVPTTPLTGHYSILRNWKEKLYHGTSFVVIQKGDEKGQDKLTNWKPGWSNFYSILEWIGLMKELCSKRGIFSKNIKTESNSLPP